ncbi:MAG: haloacid dehalogenase type II [Halomonadaceae bacterium]|nr:MAG: haloacid dehalogenase type II [Halomonadaceae bacterium]
MPRLCLFDVNETLLDLGGLDGLFAEFFGVEGVRQEWFDQVLHNAFVATITERYQPFGEIASGALTMVAQRREQALTQAQHRAVLAGMVQLPPHPEVPEALAQFKQAGFRLAALTNSTAEVVCRQLSHVGLTDMFEQILSVDVVQRLKPAQEPYRYAAKSLGVPVRQLRMIAAHGWDIAGAAAAGCATAFVARPGMIADPLIAPPDITGCDLMAVAIQIMAQDTP